MLSDGIICCELGKYEELVFYSRNDCLGMFCVCHRKNFSKKGDDYLEGGRGDDTYVWTPGDGNDTLYDYYGKNVLKIGAGVDPTKVKASRDGRNLYLTLPETGERLTLKDWYYGAAYRLSEIRFADGTVWSTQDVEDIASGAKPAFAASFDAEIEQSLTMLSAPSFMSMLVIFSTTYFIPSFPTPLFLNPPNGMLSVLNVDCLFMNTVPASIS